MRAIQEFVDRINEELESAKEYAEMFIDFKADGNITSANRYKEFASQELQHANAAHDEAVAIIAKVRNVATPPEEMMEKWEHEHKRYIEKAAWIKTMLN